MKRFIVFAYFVVVGYVLAERKLPSYIKPCKRFAADLSQCWENTLIQLKPYFAKGIPEFGIAPISEFHVNHIHLDQGNTPNVNFVADLFNLTFHGGENFEVPYTKLNFKDLVLEEGLIFPKLIMKG
ncbi:hemolymph juvenile hormone-binding protein, partial [Oryctes borbonicus]